MVNKMCDIGVIPYNLVFYPSENTEENRQEIIRNGKKIYLIDTLDDGFQVELDDLAFWDDFGGHAYVKFDSYEHFLSLEDVNTVLHFIYCENCGLRLIFRNDERRFYHKLKKLEKLVDQWDVIDERGKEGHVIFAFFEGIKKILKEYEKGFKHKNKKLEKLFNKLAEKILVTIRMPSSFIDCYY